MCTAWWHLRLLFCDVFGTVLILMGFRIFHCSKIRRLVSKLDSIIKPSSHAVKDQPSMPLWTFNGGFSCKSLSKLNIHFQTMLTAMADENEDLMLKS
jgi:hypothetical protein